MPLLFGPVLRGGRCARRRPRLWQRYVPSASLAAKKLVSGTQCCQGSENRAPAPDLPFRNPRRAA